MASTYRLEDFLNSRNAFSPSLSPSGRRLVFLATIDTDTTQVHLADLDAGTSKRLTSYDDRVDWAIFSPVAEDEIIFGKAKGGDEKVQLYRQNVETGEVIAITNNPEVKYDLGAWSRDGQWLAMSSNERDAADFDVYLHRLETGESTLVFHPGGWCDAAGFSPSGRYLVVSRANTNVDNDLYLIDTTDPSHEAIKFTAHKESASFGYPRWLEDESGFFVATSQSSDFVGLSFYNLAGRDWHVVLESQWDIQGLTLKRDNTELAINFNEDGSNAVRFYELSDMKLCEIDGPHLPAGEISRVVWSQDGSVLAFFQGNYDSSYNVWVHRGDKAEQITHAPMPVPSEVFVKPELIHYRSFDGLSVPAFLYLPRDAKPPYAAIVDIHGGPEGQSRAGYLALTQYYVHHGYAVILPNVRGSAGYGKTYLALDDRHKRLDSVRDLASLHDWAVADGRIDPQRIALMGGSYGGYMVLAGLAFQPELWAAGVDIVGIANLESFLENTSSYRRALRESEYGYLATDREMLKRISPINKVDDIKAPLFIIHGANDPRVPLSEAQQIHDSLAQRGITAEMLIYDDEGHGLAKLKNRLDAYPKAAAFLDRVLLPKRSTKP